MNGTRTETPFDLLAETHRRFDILSVLYHQRRTDEDNPRLTSRELELKMGAPRGSLNFALWYLKDKGYLTREDSCAYAINANGVDYLEERAKTGRIVGFVAEAAAEDIFSAPVPDAHPN